MYKKYRIPVTERFYSISMFLKTLSKSWPKVSLREPFFYFDKFSKRGKYWKYLYFIKIVAKEKEKVVTIRIQGREILSFQLSLLAVKQRLKYFYVFSSLLLLPPKLSGNWTVSRWQAAALAFNTSKSCYSIWAHSTTTTTATRAFHCKFKLIGYLLLWSL